MRLPGERFVETQDPGGRGSEPKRDLERAIRYLLLHHGKLDR